MSETVMVTVHTAPNDSELGGDTQTFVVKSGQELIPREGLVITKIKVELPSAKPKTKSNRASNSQTD